MFVKDKDELMFEEDSTLPPSPLPPPPSLRRRKVVEPVIPKLQKMYAGLRAKPKRPQTPKRIVIGFLLSEAQNG